MEILVNRSALDRYCKEAQIDGMDDSLLPNSKEAPLISWRDGLYENGITSYLYGKEMVNGYSPISEKNFASKRVWTSNPYWKLDHVAMAYLTRLFLEKKEPKKAFVEADGYHSFIEETYEKAIRHTSYENNKKIHFCRTGKTSHWTYYCDSLAPMARIVLLAKEAKCRTNAIDKNHSIFRWGNLGIEVSVDGKDEWVQPYEKFSFEDFWLYEMYTGINVSVAITHVLLKSKYKDPNDKITKHICGALEKYSYLFADYPAVYGRCLMLQDVIRCMINFLESVYGENTSEDNSDYIPDTDKKEKTKSSPEEEQDGLTEEEREEQEKLREQNLRESAEEMFCLFLSMHMLLQYNVVIPEAFSCQETSVLWERYLVNAVLAKKNADSDNKNKLYGMERDISLWESSLVNDFSAKIDTETDAETDAEIDKIDNRFFLKEEMEYFKAKFLTQTNQWGSNPLVFYGNGFFGEGEKYWLSLNPNEMVRLSAGYTYEGASYSKDSDVEKLFNVVHQAVQKGIKKCESDTAKCRWVKL